MRKLWKTTIVIWSKEDPSHKYEIVDLAREATDGMMYCSNMIAVPVEDPKNDPDWDGTEFFDEEENEQELFDEMSREE